VLVIKRLAWVTTRGARGLDDDEPIALAALARTGASVDVVGWDDPGARWSGYDRVVLRSTWDYPQHLAEFLAWVDAVDAGSELVNPAATVRWNLDKQYLAALAEDGVPITPTVFVRPGEAAEFPDGTFVVKPAVGAGSRDAAWYRPDARDSATEHVARLHAADQTVLVQPMLASVAQDGEWPMVFFDGTFSHAACKRADLPQAGAVETLFAAETNTRHVATADQIAVATAAVEAVSRRLGTPTYARVDLVRDDDGRYCVLEVELIEPSLFLPFGDAAAADRLAEVLVRSPDAGHGSRS
jgi:glutathione synthase/RimK-type ligase-like ATP-grasp enzyme